jgi:hypothetical protein
VFFFIYPRLGAKETRNSEMPMDTKKKSLNDNLPSLAKDQESGKLPPKEHF